MKILHTSDWHLGRLFHNLSLLEDQRLVLDQLLEHIDGEEPNALIIAGDIYDRAVPPAGAVSLLNELLQKLCEERQLPVIMISGNHDSAERLGFGANQLASAGLHIASDLRQVDRPVVVSNRHGQSAHIYCIPYCDPESVRDAYADCDDIDTIKSFDDAHNFLVQKIRQNLDDQCINILVSHCFAQHGDASESERPLSIGGSDWVSVEPLKDFDYVALGHLHRPQKISADHIRYSGSLLKYSFSEVDHAKSAVLARWDEQKHFSYELLPLPASRDLRILEGELDTLLADGSQKSETERNHYYLVRLTDTHAILDVMTKLRSVYPNVLHLERPGLVSHVQANMGQEQLKRDTVDLFADFFQQVNNSSINDRQRELLQKVIVDAQQESDQ